ncbi:MAG: hypothetical protein HRU38_20130 [Saccharospirillaceae bacterium]|nr:hypothetical protein [Pseudomonadales bacterium]NRB80941.1 hypothetical protein [Saccharospirillaceae bacterium]
MLARINSILSMELKIPKFKKELAVPIFEYGVTPEEVLANYIEARDHGHPKKAYSYLTKKDKQKTSFNHFIEQHADDPFIAETVDIIHQRSKSQRFELIWENEYNAKVNWITKFPKLYCILPQYLDDNDDTVQQKIIETEAQSIEFDLIKEGVYWKIEFHQFDMYQK